MAGISENTWSISAAGTPAVHIRPFPRVLFLGLPDEKAQASTVIADGLTAEGWIASRCASFGSDRFAQGNLILRSIRRLGLFAKHGQALFSELPSCDLVHITCGSPGQVVREALPALILARFFGKATILHFVSADIEILLERHRRWLAPVLRLGGAAVTGSRHLQKVLNRIGLTVKLLTPPVSLDGLTHRLRLKLQPRILVNASLEPDLNVPAAVRAFRLVKQKYPRAELVIAGDGSQRRLLEDLVAQLRLYGVEFRGVIGAVELVKLYHECDLFLHAPLVDESPQSIVAAFAAGLPVVTSDADGLIHMIRDRASALVVPMGDHAALSDAILELVESEELCERLSAAGRSEAEKYVWSRVRQDWVNLYKSMVS